ncbi:hypothetical protein F5B17DRAFT_206406 [Nemania serpens]|nr:hypothetical protein F5B17DRAFT_206406 [Nemania serpens]
MRPNLSMIPALVCEWVYGLSMCHKISAAYLDISCASHALRDVFPSDRYRLRKEIPTSILRVSSPPSPTQPTWYDSSGVVWVCPTRRVPSRYVFNRYQISSASSSPRSAAASLQVLSGWRTSATSHCSFLCDSTHVIAAIPHFPDTFSSM